MEFVDELKKSSDPMEDCVRYLLVWLASIDGDIHDDEREWLRESLGRRPDAIAIDRVIHWVQDHDAAQDAFVLRWLGAALNDAGRQQVLELAIGVARADGRVMHSEVHALRLIADAIQISPAEFARIWRDQTNADVPDLADLSDPLFWDRTEQAARERTAGGRDKNSSNGNSAPNKGSLDKDHKTIEALAVLGLGRDASVDDIKNAYRRLAAVHHPDRFAALGGSATDVATKTFQRIKAAYDHLMNQSS
jgi:DnaJ like chaperone protein